MTYGISKTTDYTFDEAVQKVTEELKKEGFGVLTTIDVQETLKKKLDVSIARYVILGACNPPFAHRALQADPQIGLLLPCNVIVYEQGTSTVVSAFDPMAMMTLTANEAVAPIAAEVKARLVRVVAAMEA